MMLKMDDKMNRQLTADIAPDLDTPELLANELVHYGYINQVCFCFLFFVLFLLFQF